MNSRTKFSSSRASRPFCVPPVNYEPRKTSSLDGATQTLLARLRAQRHPTHPPITALSPRGAKSDQIIFQVVHLLRRAADLRIAGSGKRARWPVCTRREGEFCLCEIIRRYPEHFKAYGEQSIKRELPCSLSCFIQHIFSRFRARLERSICKFICTVNFRRERSRKAIFD